MSCKLWFGWAWAFTTLFSLWSCSRMENVGVLALAVQYLRTQIDDICTVCLKFFEVGPASGILEAKLVGRGKPGWNLIGCSTPAYTDESGSQSQSFTRTRCSHSKKCPLGHVQKARFPFLPFLGSDLGFHKFSEGYKFPIELYILLSQGN